MFSLFSKPYFDNPKTEAIFLRLPKEEQKSFKATMVHYVNSDIEEKNAKEELGLSVSDSDMQKIRQDKLTACTNLKDVGGYLQVNSDPFSEQIKRLSLVTLYIYGNFREALSKNKNVTKEIFLANVKDNETSVTCPQFDQIFNKVVSDFVGAKYSVPAGLLYVVDESYTDTVTESHYDGESLIPSTISRTRSTLEPYFVIKYDPVLQKQMELLLI